MADNLLVDRVDSSVLQDHTSGNAPAPVLASPETQHFAPTTSPTVNGSKHQKADENILDPATSTTFHTNSTGNWSICNTFNQNRIKTSLRTPP